MFTLGSALASAATAAEVPAAPVIEAASAAARTPAANVLALISTSCVRSPGIGSPWPDPQFRSAPPVHNKIVLSACTTLSRTPSSQVTASDTVRSRRVLRAPERPCVIMERAPARSMRRGPQGSAFETGVSR
ncbi:hypothetical protein GCM10010468_31230 [Actinocorallia longicatena]|uniref:Secreted protein n=1 Tax=Actinocorallia longicatena TaxID=111803 RepID=A0ABP6QAJ4_9ACTN